MVKNRYAAFALFTVLVLIFWNIVDFLCCALITKSARQLTADLDIALPPVAAIAAGHLIFPRKS